MLDEGEVERIVRRAGRAEGYRLTVDLEGRSVRDEEGFSAPFAIDDFRRSCLLEGLDDIGLTLRREPHIAAYESRRPAAGP